MSFCTPKISFGLARDRTRDSEKQKKEEEEGVKSKALRYLLLLQGETENFAVLVVLRQCPLVLMVKLGKAFGSEEDRMMGTGLLGIGSRGKKLSIWMEFCCLEGSIMTDV